MVNYNLEMDKLTCSFSAPLNTQNCMELEKSLEDKLTGVKTVIFDLHKVDYVASSFLRICQKIFKQMGANNFSVINVSPDVKKVFKITGFDKCMNIQ
jgi:anti-anti-sigma factor